MKEQKTAKETLKKHYDIMCDEDQDDWIPFEENVNSIDCMLAAMQEFSDQQNAELRERVKELEGALRTARSEIDLPDYIAEIINKALNK